MKNKSIKRLLCLLLSVIIMFSFNVTICAESILNSDENKIISVLQNTEYIKDDIGLTNIDFCELYISEPINTYEFADSGFVFLRNAYPLLIDNCVVAFALESGNGVEKTFQISTAFVEKINTIEFGTPLAIVYDNEGAYIFYNDCFSLLGLHSTKIDNRLNINNFDLDKIDRDKLDLVAITNGKHLNYTYALSSRVEIYYECDVDFVSQNPPSNLCWAASCAMIINSVRGYHYTAAQIARRHYGTSYDFGLPAGDEISVLADFSVVYTYRGIKPSDGIMLHNIRYGWPIFAQFLTDNGNGHAVVIYGINTIGGYLYIKDPEFGSCTATYNTTDGYHYISNYSGVELTFNYGTCHYWTAG
ncbi:MAG: hypothetical protein IJZ35_00285 [Clostridia bacterium]|nr:hypothetical protein [Clostridia bacterium]